MCDKDCVVLLCVWDNEGRTTNAVRSSTSVYFSNMLVLNLRSVRLCSDWLFCVGRSADADWFTCTEPSCVRRLIDIKHTCAAPVGSTTLAGSSTHIGDASDSTTKLLMVYCPCMTSSEPNN